MEKVAESLALGLQSRGHVVEVATYALPERKTKSHRGIPIIDLTFPSDFETTSPYSMLEVKRLLESWSTGITCQHCSSVPMDDPLEMPLVTVAVPSYNQGRYLNAALESIFAQVIPVEVYVADGGSTDGTIEVIRRWEERLAGWRSSKDMGQSSAINEAIANGRAPFVCWLNSDDWLLPGALKSLVAALQQNPAAPMAYGRVWNYVESTKRTNPVFVRPFSEWWMAQFCIVSQPGTLIRRTAREAKHRRSQVTPIRFKAHLRAQGKTIRQWAEDHGFPESAVYRVLNGLDKGNFGRAHDIAIAAGLKAAPEQLAA